MSLYKEQISAIKYQIEYSKRFESIRDDWNNIFKTRNCTYFSSPQWHQCVLELYKSAKLTNKLRKIVYFTAKKKDSSQIDAIGFFTISRKKGKKLIEFSPIIGPSDYYDFCFSKDFNVNIEEIIMQISKDFNADSISFSHVKEESKLGNFISISPNAEINRLSCVSINLPDDYEIYFSSLSKSVKQNIRTAYNRIAKNNLEFTLQIFTPSIVENVDLNELLDLYKLRNAFRVEKKYWKSRLMDFLNYPFSKEKDIFELKSLKATDYTIAIFKIDESIAAYFFGFEKNGKIEINRVVINDEFKYYSPGLLLINEYIKKNIQKGLQSVDLTVGDEKYKYDLGGTTHHILNAQIGL